MSANDPATSFPALPEPAPGEPLAQLLAVLDLRRVPEAVAGPSEVVFEGQNQPTLHGRVFGGQVLGQALVAASRTLDPAVGARPAHSLHGYFLRAGDPSLPITFAVEVLRDGRSFSARRVQASQQGSPILSMIASFQTVEEGLDHAVAMPDVPGPESLPTTADLVGHIEHPMAQHWAHWRPIDVRHVGSAVYLDGSPVSDHQAVWLRADGALPDDDALHRAVLAYASDFTMLEPVMRRHGVAWVTPGLKAASLDHAMWWHREVRADEWLLFAQTSPSASGARGLTQGHLFTRDGRLVATVAQEGMVRVPPRP